MGQLFKGIMGRDRDSAATYNLCWFIYLNYAASDGYSAQHLVYICMLSFMSLRCQDKWDRSGQVGKIATTLFPEQPFTFHSNYVVSTATTS